MQSLRRLNYEDRLTKLDLSSLESRRKLEDKIMLCKCVTAKEKIDVRDYIVYANRKSRGHSKKIYKGSKRT